LNDEPSAWQKNHITLQKLFFHLRLQYPKLCRFSWEVAFLPRECLMTRESFWLVRTKFRLLISVPFARTLKRLKLSTLKPWSVNSYKKYDNYLLPHLRRLRLFCPRFCYLVFNSHMFNVTELQLWKWCFHLKFLLLMRPIHVWLSRTPYGLLCALFPGVITTIMDQKVQLLKPLNWVVYHVAEPMPTSQTPGHPWFKPEIRE
jgi:hypothetical protein